jgi:biotin carboxylase
VDCEIELTMSKTLLVVSAGVESAPGIRVAREMGLHVVATDRDPEAPGFAFADDRLIASTYDVEATLGAALDYHRRIRPIDAVIAIASDVPLTVATVAAELGLPGIPRESARLAQDKLAMKRRFARDGVPTPWFSSVESEQALRRLALERGYPLVLKPVDSRGSRGVLRLAEGIDLGWAFAFSRSHSPTGRVMLEEFLEGPQVSTESLVVDGTAHTPGFADRNYEFMERFAPHIIENGGQLPTALPVEVRARVREVVQAAARSLGIRDGVVKGDIVVCGGAPFVVEIAARLSGGFLCTHEIPLSTGVPFVRHAIRVALGERPTAGELAPRTERGVAQRWLFPEPGRIRSISGVEQARQMPGVRELILRAQPGDVVSRPADSNAAIGVVMAVGASREEAILRAERAVAAVRVETEPP